MTPTTSPVRFRRFGVRCLTASLLVLSFTLPGIAQEANPPASSTTTSSSTEAERAAAKRDAAIKTASQDQNAPVAAPRSDEVITLSPFQVDATKDVGYFAQNTLAGSRMRMNLSDLGSSISVVTKQQMEDTASIDINDVFRYEVNTEGSLTYTATTSTFRSDGVLDVNAGGTQGNSLSNYTNSTANRVRGLGSPSMAINYFPSISQIPMDSYNVQSLEISRGPNSMIFGLGSPAGIVNQSTAQAILNRNTYKVTARTDQNGSYRGTLAFNRSLIKDKLAIYGSIVYNNQQFERKPSYDLTKRQYGAFTFKPFAKTTIRADVENYRNDNRRPNTLTPRDYVTQWNLAGQPWYDPVSGKITLGSTGKVVGEYVYNASSPYADEVRAVIATLPGYDASKWNSAKTTYNGVSIFGDAALTTSTGFNPATGTAANNILFVPGITWTNFARTVMQIADGQLVNWFQPLRGQRYRVGWGTSTNPAGTGDYVVSEAQIWANSTWANIYNRGYTTSTGWTGTNNGIIGYKYPGVTDKSIYDWTSVNINQMNWGQDTNQNYHVELDQEILDNLYFNAGWFRQDFKSKTNYTVAQLNVTTLFVDTNKYLPDGSVNTLFGKPYVEDTDPDRYINNQLDDHFRAMLAWTPDFTRKNGWLKWLGHHQLLGMWSRDESMLDQRRQRLEYVDSTTLDGKIRYMANENANSDGSATGWNYQTTSLRRTFYLASPTDPVGVVTRSSGEWNYTAYSGDITVYDYATSSFKTVNMTTVYNTMDASTARTQRLLNSWSGGLTSYLWNDRLIATFGVRNDEYKARVTSNSTSAITDENGNVLFDAITNADKWVDGVYQYDALKDRWQRWQRISGVTKTGGGVLRPFQKWETIERRADSGSLFWQFVRDFGISYNWSNNFNPPSGSYGDFFGNPLPKPTGVGKDYGFQFSLFNNKLFARVTWFQASNKNEQFSATTTLSRLASNIDTTLFRGWARTIAMINMGMDPKDTSTFGVNLSTADEAAIETAAAVIWQQPYDYYSSLPYTTGYGTRNADAQGYEVELSYNPTRNWTIKATFARQDTKYTGVLKEFDAWYAVRYPIWQAAKAADYLLPAYQSLATYTTTGGREVDLTNFWTSYGFDTSVLLTDASGNTNVSNYYSINVTPQVTLSRDLEGQSAPGQRKYHGALTTNYTFTSGRLKGFSVGGSERLESKAVIGYYGKASGANGTSLDVSDVTRPIYDGSHSYTDLWVAYTRRIMKDKIQWKLQLNVSNVFENGGLRAVAVNYDGSPYAFRIIDPRQFILTSTFDF